METAEESQLIFQNKDLIGIPINYFFWIGVIKENNQWIYDGGRQVTFFNWYPQYPYNDVCAYASTNMNTRNEYGFQWLDYSCSYEHFEILCEA